MQNFEKIEKGLKSYTIKRNSRNVKTISKLLGKLKQMIWKIKVFHEYFSKTLWINKTSTIDKIVIVDKFDEFFINIGSNLASKTQPSNKSFDSYLPCISTIFAENSITKKQFKKAFFCWNLIKLQVLII